MAIYWEFQIEETIDGEVQDPNVFMSIIDGKISKKYGDVLIPNNFASLYVYSSFVDDGVKKRGFTNSGDIYNAPFTREFVIVKMTDSEDEGIIDRDYIYLNEDGSLPNGLPKYVQKAFDKCIKEGAN
mgnify:FL=1